jgi:hypothetical protein
MAEQKEAEFYKARVEALRSGEYKQVQGVLKKVEVKEPGGDEIHRVVGYCCMGVACELIPGIEATLLEDDEDEEYERPVYFDSNYELPPAAFYRWLGLGDYDSDHVYLDVPLDLRVQKDTTPAYLGDNEMLAISTNLANMNDGGEFTFAQIADCIAYFGVTMESPEVRMEREERETTES